MDRINEIGDTPKGQYALGQVYARANKRLGDLTDAWTKQMPKKKYYTAAEYYPKGQKKYADIMHDAKAEAECPPNRKVNMKPVVYNDKGYETTNFGLGIMDYEKSHKTNENKQYTNMNKKQIRLTESDLKQIVKESVNKILDEAYGTPTNATKELINRYKNKEDDGFSGIRTIYNQLSSLAERTDQYTTLTPLDDNFRIPRKYVELIRKHIHKAMDVCQMVMNKVVMSQGEQPESHRSPYSRDYFDKRKPQGYGGYGGGEQRDFSGLPGWGG